MPTNSIAIKKDVDGKPIPQHYDENTGQFEVTKGEDGALKVMLNQDVAQAVYEAIRKDDIRGLSTDSKPVTGVNVGATFFEIDTQNVYMYDGTIWRMI